MMWPARLKRWIMGERRVCPVCAQGADVVILALAKTRYWHQRTETWCERPEEVLS